MRKIYLKCHIKSKKHLVVLQAIEVYKKTYYSRLILTHANNRLSYKNSFINPSKSRNISVALVSLNVMKSNTVFYNLPVGRSGTHILSPESGMSPPFWICE